MQRTTVMADEELLEAARRVADREQISLAEVIRQGIELRVRQRTRPPRFIGAFASGNPGHTAARDSADAPFEPASWR
jgi:hypothetical protein